MIRQTMIALVLFTAFFALVPDAEAHRKAWHHRHRPAVVIKPAKKVVVRPAPKVVVAPAPVAVVVAPAPAKVWVAGQWVWFPRGGYRWVPAHWE